MKQDISVTLPELRTLIQKNKRFDILFSILGFLSLLLAVMTFLVLFAQMAVTGWERISPAFFTNFPSRRAESAGILSALVGSILVMLVTAVAAIPLGVGAGVYLEEYAPKNLLTDIIEINVTNLAGVPSIVYGLLALGVFVYGFGLGQSILTAGLTLALLILPIIIVSTRESIRAIPSHIREAAYGMGATKWQVVRDHIIPYSLSGILTGIIIGLSRAIGETAPIITIGALTFIAFLPPSPVSSEFPWVNFDWLSSGFTVMPIQMFNWTSRPAEAFQVNAAAAGFILVLLTLSMNALAIFLRYRLRKNISW
ncbi:phosphate ABC transporter permease PstA [Acinetobacter johnsonii]|jgi:phosphate transport system permease protein|uniref:phosphate ABC transporter permease PstA n=1 Tax=Acinetobacter johnsonii TaxID=40214 RepID=UPI000A46E7A0|nr:phosphate ABC transporter permease PstA [Acinetobacter johnsonii]MDH1278216.1 phosphate ABC transporter permease PstA [Acinetobacter johnsonii]